MLNDVAQKFLVLFGSTWSCESGFSVMNHIKNKLRCRLTDTRFAASAATVHLSALPTVQSVVKKYAAPFFTVTAFRRT